MDTEKKQLLLWGQKFFAIVFFALLAAAGLLLVLYRKDAEVSEREQRMLSGCPDFSVDRFLSGEFQAEYETYLSDRFFGRDFLYSRYQEIRYLLGNRHFGEYLAGKGGSVLAIAKPWEETPRQNLAQFLAALSAQMPEGRKVVFLAPEASQVMTGWVPRGGYAKDQRPDFEAFCEELKRFEAAGKDDDFLETEENGTSDGHWQVTSALISLRAGNDRALYYKSDHHWNSRGAYVAAGEILRLLGKQIRDEDYVWSLVKNDFYGTCASGTGLYVSGDVMELCEPRDFRYTVHYVQEDRKETTCFDWEKLDGMQPYEVFFGGNFGQLDIRTEAYSEGTLLVVKDSFANCLIPMLLPHYRRIVVVDPRYYTGEWELLLEGMKGCDMLWLFRQNTLAGLDVAALLTDGENPGQY